MAEHETLTRAECDTLTKPELLVLASDLACAYFKANQVSIANVGEVVSSFLQILSDFNKSPSSMKDRLPVAPAVAIEDSVHDDYIVCLEDGKRLQMLKRHLSTVYHMSIDEYKDRWGLGADYPVVSPSYARRRSSIAKSSGLGRGGNKKMRIMDSKVGSAAIA
jgi:predicted transcriptional regulator